MNIIFNIQSYEFHFNARNTAIGSAMLLTDLVKRSHTCTLKNRKRNHTLKMNDSFIKRSPEKVCTLKDTDDCRVYVELCSPSPKMTTTTGRKYLKKKYPCLCTRSVLVSSEHGWVFINTA